ncbi:hypothetical protein LXA43DRAFT_1091016 [Ganoderma leucocontextum]|nr:hypothetical protein LXA43DRAFT_1091016 [Ganoderma leucocontextum]
MTDVPARRAPMWRSGVLRFPNFHKKTHEGDSPEEASSAINPLDAILKVTRPLPGSGPSPSPNVASTSPAESIETSEQGLGRPEPAGPAVFKRNRIGHAPAICGPWEGKVASQGVLSGFVITSPSQEHVPHMPRDVNMIQTYVDGRWGVHEYSRHPQWYIEEMTHVACIPWSASPPDIPDILFTSLDTDKHWEEDASVAVRGLGQIRALVRKDLAEAAATAIRRTETIAHTKDAILRYTQFLVMLLRQVMDRMNYLPSVATRVIAIAAHIQRVCLELAELKTYLDIVVGLVESSKDFSASVLDVVGGFVREGAVTQTWHRVGIPYWVLQPLNTSLSVWRIVEEDPLPYDLARQVCDPPILHSAGAFVGVSNLTGNWISSMLVSVSKHIAGSHLSSLHLTSVPQLPSEHTISSKRPRVEEKTIISSHLSMRTADAEPQAGASKGARRQACRKATAAGHIDKGQTTSGTNQSQVAAGPPRSAGFAHPSRYLLLSPFVDISEIWIEVLRAAGPVPQTPNLALYFFPPPFLLDTVTSMDSLPPGCVYPDRARADAKVSRYLHNLVRIHEFCRTRLFDISLDDRPLTITEWRAALWGEYLPQTSIRAASGKSDLALVRLE